MTLTIGSLCSGFGGLDQSVMGVLDASVAWHCQFEPPDKDGRPDRHQYAARILAHHWPGVPNHGDITAIDWARVEPVDIITAGFPCQPVSNAGKRRGHEDERWLWPDVEAAIRRVRPRLVFLENVSALANRGGRRRSRGPGRARVRCGVDLPTSVRHRSPAPKGPVVLRCLGHR